MYIYLDMHKSILTIVLYARYTLHFKITLFVKQNPFNTQQRTL